MEKTKAHQSNRNATRMLCEGAIFVAMAQILGYFKFFRMPQAGSVSLLMLPILLFALRWGWQRGLLAGLVLGLLQFLLDDGIALGWQSMLGDYVIACTLLGLAGVFARRKWGVFPGLVLGCLGRYAAILVTGATLWGEYMPSEFWGLSMTNTWVYSALYNMPIAVSGAVCIAVAAALYAVPALRIYLTGQDILE